MEQVSGSPNKDPRTGAIIGAAIEVHRELGPGYLERVYHEALKIELGMQAIPFTSEVELPIFYDGERLDASYRADLVCYDDILVELKPSAIATRAEYAQVMNYLKACTMPVGLLLHFGGPVLGVRRFAGASHFQPRPNDAGRLAPVSGGGSAATSSADGSANHFHK